VIPLEEAQRLVVEASPALKTEVVPLLSAWGRVLRKNIYAVRNVPPLDNSAMDGYAIQTQDLWSASAESVVRLRVIGEVAAGKAVRYKVGAGEAVRIMTGAPMPQGADAVVPVEYTREEEGWVLIGYILRSGENVRLAGEDVRCGSLVAEAGDVLSAAKLGLLAAQGIAQVEVSQRPRVGILATGDEVVDVGRPAAEHQVYNSNSYTLAALVRSAGAEVELLGVVGDEVEELRERLRQGMQGRDVLITTGGVSAGRYDLVKKALDELGFELIFWKVAIKPGMPTLFGRVGECLVFGLPGNPVAAMVTFEEFVRPALYRLCGKKECFLPVVEAKVKEGFRKRPGRLHLLRVRLEVGARGCEVELTGAQGSGMLTSMVHADGLLMVPADRTEVEAGERLPVQLLPGWP